MKSIVFGWLAGLLAIATPVFAGEPEWLQRLDRSRPETVAEQARQCAVSNDALCAAYLADPAVLRDIREVFTEVFERVEPEFIPSVFLEVLGDKTPGELKTLDDAQFFATFLAGLTRQPGMQRVKSLNLIGGLYEGDELYHVLGRATYDARGGDDPAWEMRVISLGKVDGRWRLQPPKDFQQIRHMLKRLRSRPDSRPDSPWAPQAAEPAAEEAAQAPPTRAGGR
ncbi:hypothetical protein [Lysobacter sp. CA196]|uniref:hypothetical protein n=1 Tax=Lysobacter sp. CA196 TaxID=3455606 RepID=UPI003F8D5547